MKLYTQFRTADRCSGCLLSARFTVIEHWVCLVALKGFEKVERLLNRCLKVWEKVIHIIFSSFPWPTFTPQKDNRANILFDEIHCLYLSCTHNFTVTLEILGDSLFKCNNIKYQAIQYLKCHADIYMSVSQGYIFQTRIHKLKASVWIGDPAAHVCAFKGWAVRSGWCKDQLVWYFLPA